MDSPHKVLRRGILVFSLICAWTNGWANNLDAGDMRRRAPTLRRHCYVPCDIGQRLIGMFGVFFIKLLLLQWSWYLIDIIQGYYFSLQSIRTYSFICFKYCRPWNGAAIVVYPVLTFTFTNAYLKKYITKVWNCSNFITITTIIGSLCSLAVQWKADRNLKQQILGPSDICNMC